MRYGICLCLLILAASISPPANANETDFDRWLTDFRKEATSLGISDKVLDTALGNARPIKRVIELDRRQPEFTMTFDQYLSKIASATRARVAAKKLVEHDEILTKVSQRYGVQKRYIVTFWGVETNFGQYLGSFNVPHSLATLAHDGRRSAYFRKELLNALKILEEGHIAPDKMKGSWAGAMGQSQFMPSSFLSYAVDWNGDGKRDIWETKADVFASTAYYLSKAGWRNDMTWGREVKIPADLMLDGKGPKALADAKARLKLLEWSRAGITKTNGKPLPSRDFTARLVLPAGSNGPAYLVYSNFDSILAWNRSNYYALAIGHLSDKLR
ncbi:lytic murein transglycosylase [Candidatus Puniceispirillum sp.]|nr:lytic murein transglycosylase [Candidatus Puniceispirillum sp.]